MENTSTQQKWYDKIWLVILLCVIFFPVGLYALWKNQPITKGWKIGVTIIIALIVISQLGKNNDENVSSNSSVSSNSVEQTERKSFALTSNNTNRPKKLSEQEKLAEKLNIALEQAENIFSVLANLGITKFNKFEPDEYMQRLYDDESTAYSVEFVHDYKTYNIDLTLDSDKSVKEAFFSASPIYRNGQIIAKVSDYLLTSSEIANYMTRTQLSVQDILVSPRTAKFPGASNWTVYRNPEGIYIRSYVDSQNAFGANIRSNFEVNLNPDGKSIKSFIFDGQRVK